MLNVTYRLNETAHPYTRNGVEIEVLVNGNWLEVCECGEIHPALLQPGYSGLAFLLGIRSFHDIKKGDR